MKARITKGILFIVPENESEGTLLHMFYLQNKRRRIGDNIVFESYSEINQDIKT